MVEDILKSFWKVFTFTHSISLQEVRAKFTAGGEAEILESKRLDNLPLPLPNR